MSEIELILTFPIGIIVIPKSIPSDSITVNWMIKCSGSRWKVTGYSHRGELLAAPETHWAVNQQLNPYDWEAA